MKHLIYIIASLFLAQNILGQEILYQRPDANISFNTISDSANIYRLNIGHSSFSISKYDDEMHLQDVLVFYTQDNLYFHGKRNRKVKLKSFDGFEKMLVSSNKIHLIFSYIDEKEKKRQVLDLRIDKKDFKKETLLESIYQITSKRAINLRYSESVFFPYSNFDNTEMKMVFQKPNRMQDNFSLGLVTLKIEDEIKVIDDSNIEIGFGITRDDFSITNVKIDSLNNILCFGDKTVNYMPQETKEMYFFKPHDATKFKKLSLSLKDKDIVDVTMFNSDKQVLLFGLYDDKDDAKGSFTAFYKEGKYASPNIVYYDNDKQDVLFKTDSINEVIEVERRLKKVQKINQSYYLVFQYAKYPETPTVYSYAYVPKPYYQSGMVLQKYDNNMKMEWEQKIDNKVIYRIPYLANFTSYSILENKENIFVAYNDVYTNWNKSLSDTSDVCVIDSYVNNSEAKKEIVRNEKIEKQSKDNSTAFTLSFIKINKESGEAEKIQYPQRKLYSLIWNRHIRKTNKGKYYFVYYIWGKFGICSIDLNTFII